MAIATRCQTSGAIFHSSISGTKISCEVDLPMDLELTEEQAQILEANIHNMIEIVLAPYFK